MVSHLKYTTTSTTFIAAAEEAEYHVGSHNNALYWYKDGAWSQITPPGTKPLERILYDVCSETDFPWAEKGKQLWNTIALKAPELPRSFGKSTLIATPTGILNPEDGSLTETLDPEDYVTRRIAVPYDPEATCPQWEQMLWRMVEDKDPKDQAQYVDFLQQWFGMAIIGYGKYGSRALRKMLFMHGPPRTGKSSIAAVLSAFFNTDDICSADVDQASSRFGLTQLVGAQAYIADDAVGAKSKMDSKTFKKIVTGEPLVADRKFKDATTFVFNGPVCLTANSLPKIEDETDAMYQRAVVLSFDRVFSGDEAKEQLKGHSRVVDFLQAEGEMPGVLNWALRGMRIAVENGSLPTVQSAKETAAGWRAGDDPVYAFMSNYCSYDPKVYTQVTTLGAAVWYFASVSYGVPISMNKATQAVGKVGPSVVAGVVNDRKSRHGVQFRALVGLRVSDEGLRWIDAAKESGKLPRGTPLVANSPAL